MDLAMIKYFPNYKNSEVKSSGVSGTLSRWVEREDFNLWKGLVTFEKASTGFDLIRGE
jgi:hypothetical protein